MMPSISLEFLVALLFIIDLFLIFLLFLFVKRVNRINTGYGTEGNEVSGPDPEEIAQIARQEARDAAREAVAEVSQMLEPLLEASREAALDFDKLIREKKKLTRDLNQALDSKMISMNLLLSRANSLHKQLEEQQYEIRRSRPELAPASSLQQEPDVLDQQNQIIDLYYKQVDIDTIAERLSIPKGEVQLVIDLKEKFIAMEQT